MATEKTAGERNIEWIEAYCCVPDGKLVGQPVKLTKEQKKWIRLIYDSPTRMFILSMGRKNAKTATSAMLLLLHLAGREARVNGQLYSAAQSRDQAAILFNYAAKMVRMSPDLSACVNVRDSSKQLVCEGRGTIYRALSADATTAYGLSPTFVVHDELGQVRGPRSELYDALESASAAHESPLSVVISTQAPTDNDLLSKLIDDAQSKNSPKTTKLVLYTANETDNPFAKKTIRQANPHFDVFMNADEVMLQAKRAKRMPEAEAQFRNLILNQRVNVTNPFVSKSVWEDNGGAPDLRAFERNPVYIGLDLSAKQDLTAAVAVTKGEDELWHVQAFFFAPEKGVMDRARRDRVPYDVWAQQGFLTLTPGASVDYAWVAQRLCELYDDYDVQTIPFDRWRIDSLKAELAKMGRELPLVPFGQGFKDMTPALDALEGALVAGKLRHGMNPILYFCAHNAVATLDPAGNRKLDKSKATGRIDGMVALAMAMGAAAMGESSNEIQQGFVVIN